MEVQGNPLIVNEQRVCLGKLSRRARSAVGR